MPESFFREGFCVARMEAKKSRSAVGGGSGMSSAINAAGSTPSGSVLA